MIYTKAPHSIKQKANTLFLYCPAGLFLVEEPAMMQLLLSLQHVDHLSESELRELCTIIQQHDFEYSDVIEYLTKEVEILIELKPGARQKSVFVVDIKNTHTRFLKSVLNKSYHIVNMEDFEEGNIPDDAVLLFLSTEWPSDYLLKYIMEKVTAHQICLFTFQVGDISVVSHAWAKKTCAPCPLCLYDYLLDKVYSDNTNKINSLSNIIDLLAHEFDTDAPNMELEDIDVACLLRIATHYTDTIAGTGRGTLSACSPKKITTMNALTLEKHSYEIPFSFRCNCLNHYREYMEVKNA